MKVRHGKTMQVVDKETGMTYNYNVSTWEDGRKSIGYEGIVPYEINQRLKKQLSKKYKWLKEQLEQSK